MSRVTPFDTHAEGSSRRACVRFPVSLALIAMLLTLGNTGCRTMPPRAAGIADAPAPASPTSVPVPSPEAPKTTETAPTSTRAKEDRAAIRGLFSFGRAHHWARDASAAADDSMVLLSPEIGSGDAWNEAIVSWNVAPATGSGLQVEALESSAPAGTPWRNLGWWSVDATNRFPRTSVRGQRGDWGAVKTDVLALTQPATGLRLRLTLRGELATQPERLVGITVALSDTSRSPQDRPSFTNAWGRLLEVPERSQVSYADGRAWCSPTSVSMVLGWWAKVLARPELDRDVPEVAREVHDPGWSGTGNWPFNMAYAASLGGLRSAACRLRDLRDVEELVHAGVPVVLSVNPPALRGKPNTPDDGHLVVVVGFTESGDVIVNDPWARLEEGQRVRRTYLRDNVLRAWRHSHRLAYWIVPESRLDLFPGASQ